MRKQPRGGPWVFDELFKRMAVELSEVVPAGVHQLHRRLHFF